MILYQICFVQIAVFEIEVFFLFKCVGAPFEMHNGILSAYLYQCTCRLGAICSVVDIHEAYYNCTYNCNIDCQGWNKLYGREVY